MGRSPRIVSPTGIYHLTARGNGRQLIFEDDQDRLRFVNQMRMSFRPLGMSVMAWALMGNHVHIIAEDPLDDLSAAMRSLLSSYAQYFNRRHGHVGHVFQERYNRFPIMSNAYLLQAIDYVHLNPARGMGCDLLSYRWSSLTLFLTGHDEFDLINTKRLDDLGCSITDVESYYARLKQELHRSRPSYTIRERLDDEAVIEFLSQYVQPHSVADIKAMEKIVRDQVLIAARRAGATVDQLARICGLGTSTIKRATKDCLEK